MLFSGFGQRTASIEKYMTVMRLIFAKNNYFEEIIRSVLFVFFNKNVDNSVDKWNNSCSIHTEFTV